MWISVLAVLPETNFFDLQYSSPKTTKVFPLFHQQSVQSTGGFTCYKNAPMAETNGGLDVHLKQPFINFGILLSALIIVSGCAVKRPDPWSQFMDTVIKSAQTNNYDTLIQELSLYRWEDIKTFYRQASIIEAVSPNNLPNDEELYSAMREDVKMFVRSYEDLFSGKPVKYSTRRLDIEGVDLFSVILWVEKDDAYSGILVHAVWHRTTDFKVLEWVYTKPSDDPLLFKKRAILTVHDLQACEFPPAIEFDEE